MAAIFWSSVGAFLSAKGIMNLIALHEKMSLLFVIMWMIGGMLKGWFVLDRIAEKVKIRTYERGKDKCMFGFQSARNWLLVLFMIVLGRLLRWSPLNPSIVWGIYVAIGTALMFSSRRLWQKIFKEAER